MNPRKFHNRFLKPVVLFNETERSLNEMFSLLLPDSLDEACNLAFQQLQEAAANLNTDDFKALANAYSAAWMAIGIQPPPFYPNVVQGMLSGRCIYGHTLNLFAELLTRRGDGDVHVAGIEVSSISLDTALQKDGRIAHTGDVLKEGLLQKRQLVISQPRQPPLKDASLRARPGPLRPLGLLPWLERRSHAAHRTCAKNSLKVRDLSHDNNTPMMWPEQQAQFPSPPARTSQQGLRLLRRPPCCSARVQGIAPRLMVRGMAGGGRKTRKPLASTSRRRAARLRP